ATLLPWYRAQPTFAIAFQQQTAPGITSRSLRLGSKKVLAEKNILSAVAIEIAHDNGKGRSKLRLDGQRDGLEMISAVEKGDRGEGVGADVVCLRQARS